MDGKLRYNVIFATPASAMTVSTPTERIPARENNEYAARITRSLPVSRPVLPVLTPPPIATIPVGVTQSNGNSGFADVHTNGSAAWHPIVE